MNDPVRTGDGSGTWLSGLFGVLALTIGTELLGHDSLPQLAMLMFGTLMLAASAVWALHERRYQAFGIWGVATILGVFCVVAAAT